MDAGQKRVLLIIGGGIAAYKCLDLVRRLGERGIATRAILTEAGARFVTPLSVAALTGDKIYDDLFDLTDEAEMGHIELSRSADLVVVAPATANLMAQMAGGLAPDLASTALLATDKPVLIAPAMNVRMWQHPATGRNLDRLTADGVHVVGPNEGDMACGEFGPGRMAEPTEIADAIERLLGQREHRPLAGQTVLVTSGPTHEPIDPVRYLGNRSSGRQGHAIAAACVAAGARTILVSGPVAIADPPGAETVHVETAQEMLAACEDALPIDIAICAAAVADWRAKAPTGSKLKKSAPGAGARFDLVQNPDILHFLARHDKQRPALVIGFAAETENVAENAAQKRLAKGCDWILANDVSPGTKIMGGDKNKIHLITAAGTEDWPLMPKGDVAAKLIDRIAQWAEQAGKRTYARAR